MKDLDVIANLEFAKAVNRISVEAQEKMKKVLAGMPRGGQMELAKLRVQMDQSEEICREYARIWVDLVEQKNGGLLTRGDVTFILGKVGAVVATRKSSLLTGPAQARLASSVGEMTRRMGAVYASINTDLEIRIRKQQAFPPKKEPMSYKQVNVTIHHAANVNLGSQVGTINSALSAISEQAGPDQEIVKALREFTDAVAKNSQFQDAQKQETLEVIEGIAKEAEANPESRSTGRLKALISGLPTLLAASKDLLELWEKCSPPIRHFFNLPQ
jgi:hypothetical protein